MDKAYDIHNYQKRLNRVMERIVDEKELPEHNSKIAVGFKNELLTQGISVPKTVRYMQDVIWLNRQFKGKNFDDICKENIKELLANMNQSSLSEWTKRGIKTMLRKFYKFIRGVDEKGKYPPEVDFFTLTISKANTLIPEELLTEVEMGKLIRAGGNDRNRALLALLCESGCRVGEIGALTIKHISFEEYGARITVRGKTGMRKIIVLNSTPFLQIWLNNHPNGDDPNAPLWVGPNGEFLSYARIKSILQSAAKKSKLRKRIYPHLLRHSRATILAKTLSDANMKNYLGWAQGSKMASVYIHMSGKDTDEAILKANGIEIKKEKIESPLKPIECIRCHMKNPYTNRFCTTCGLPLNEESARKVLEIDTKRNRAEEIMNKLMEDPEVLEVMAKKLNG